MFTGIIQNLAEVSELNRRDGSLGIAVKVSGAGHPYALGESVAVDGICLTVVEPLPRPEKRELHFFASPETLARTNLGKLQTGKTVNLERALTPSSMLSGHWVQGHVDGLAKLVSVQEDSGSFRVEFELPENLLRYCVEKGSITLNGVSLTINAIRGDRIALTLIPHTWENTNLSRIKPGDCVNVENDVVAKYVERLCQPYLKH